MNIYYILTYTAAADFNIKKEPYQPEHKLQIQEAYDKGTLVMAGGLLEPSNGGMLIFKGESPKVAEDFAVNDTYVKNGVIIKWSVRPWNVVIEG